VTLGVRVAATAAVLRCNGRVHVAAHTLLPGSSCSSACNCCAAND
jgi:hypothetical protein